MWVGPRVKRGCEFRAPIVCVEEAYLARKTPAMPAMLCGCPYTRYGKLVIHACCGRVSEGQTSQFCRHHIEVKNWNYAWLWLRAPLPVISVYGMYLRSTYKAFHETTDDIVRKKRWIFGIGGNHELTQMMASSVESYQEVEDLSSFAAIP